MDGLQNVLNLGDYCNVDYLRLLFKRFDRLKLGHLTFNQFSDAILPFS